MSRDVPFDDNAICDECGAEGAYDFMGDCLCSECSSKYIEEECEETNEEFNERVVRQYGGATIRALLDIVKSLERRVEKLEDKI